MPIAKARWDEKLDLLAYELDPRITKQLFRQGVDQNDGSLVIGDHHRVWRGLQQAAKFLLDLLPLGDIANGRGNEPAFRGLHRRETDFDGKLGSIFSDGMEIQPRAHRTGARIAKILEAMLRMLAPEARRDEDIDRLAHQLFSLVAEQLLQLDVEQADEAVLADNDHRVGNDLEEATKTYFAGPLILEALELGDVPLADGDVWVGSGCADATP